MKYPRYVRVSPDAPDKWWDPKSGLWFNKEDEVIELKNGIDATNITRYLRFNYLIDITSLVKPPVKEEEKPQKFVEKTVKQLLNEQEKEAQVPVVEEVRKEEKPAKVACPHCGKECVPKGLPNHIRFCKENPDNKKE